MSTIHVQKRIKQSGGLATIRYSEQHSFCAEYQCVAPASFNVQLFGTSPPPAKWFCELHLSRNLITALKEAT